MRYVHAKLADDEKSRAYRFYATDVLKMIAENTARFMGGTSPTKRYYEIVVPPVIETRTSEEIITGIKDKIQKIGGETS